MTHASAKPFLLYGATGYTGTLIAEKCAAQKIPVTLAGRSEGPLQALAARLSLPFVVASLDDAMALDKALVDASCVVHCAGPFSRTARPMVDACLRAGRHYLDITGEIAVFEALAARDAEAKARDVMLLPGVGFDVVPSDCMAAHVARRLPTATKLRLCIGLFGKASHGTTTTMVEHMERGGAVRKGGVIVEEPAASRTHPFDLGEGRVVQGLSVPWGDVSTAFHSTKIPDIEVYFSLPPRLAFGMKLTRLMSPLLRAPAVKRFIQSRIPQGGPSADERARGKTIIVAEAEDAAAKRAVARLTGTEGYTMTVDTALLCARRVTEGNAPTGFQTPSKAYGPDLVLEAPGCARVDVT